MRQAFSSTKQAVAFGLLLLLLFAAPWLGGKKLLPPREQAYASEGWTWGQYPWIEKQIFFETNEIDIAFLGSSHINWDIDTPYVQQQLSKRLGHDTVVRSICWSGAGFDTLYFVTRDLLAHRRVKTLVIYDESTGRNPNMEAPHWFRFGDDASAIAGLPLKFKSIYYFAAVVGMPRSLLELFAPNLPEETNSLVPNMNMTSFHADNPETRMGSVNARISYSPHIGDNTNFALYSPKTDVTAAEVRVWNPTTASNFVFLDRPLSAWQDSFAKKFGSLVQSHGCKLVVLHLPTMEEKASSVITESQFWPRLFQMEVVVVGIPTGRLFAGLSQAELERLYGDPGHFNLNGQKYFTQLIVPSLLQ